RTVIVTADIHWDLSAELRSCELTRHLNLSALVTCHTLYVVLTTWQSAVFLLNSRLTHFTATGSILSCAQKEKLQKTKIQAPKKLRSPTSRHSGGQPARCLEFGAWGFGICSVLLSAKWSRHPFFRSYGARLP